MIALNVSATFMKTQDYWRNKMTINEMNMHPAELIEHRLRQEKANRNKIASDAKGKGDSLTYPNSKADTIYSETTRAIGDYKDEKLCAV